jgi:hypothetical protein
MTTNQTKNRLTRGGVDLSQWTRSSKCSAGVCIEARIIGSTAELRDSKQNHLGTRQPMLSLPLAAFETFQDELIGRVAAGTNGRIVVDQLENGWVAFRSIEDGVTLRYDADELAAFVAGIRVGEFRLAAA